MNSWSRHLLVYVGILIWLEFWHESWLEFIPTKAFIHCSWFTKNPLIVMRGSHVARIIFYIKRWRKRTWLSHCNLHLLKKYLPLPEENRSTTFAFPWKWLSVRLWLGRVTSVLMNTKWGPSLTIQPWCHSGKSMSDLQRVFYVFKSLFALEWFLWFRCAIINIKICITNI